MYSVKEIFYSLQGEGARSGRSTVFLRFAGCNLWNGIEEDRHKAICTFCDTDFVGTHGTLGGKYESPEDLARIVLSLWPKETNSLSIPYVVCTGGEPLLQLNEPLIAALHLNGFEVAIETNGTLNPPLGIDWICMSPKPNTIINVKKGNELKFIFPQDPFLPQEFEHFDFQYFFIQPMDGPDIENNIKKSLKFCLEHPQWQLSLQTHKMLGIR